MLEDRLLVLRLKQGKVEALERIYCKYKDDLLGLALSLLGDRADAEDAVQDVFVAFARVSATLHLRASLKGYLLTAAANRARSVMRSRRSQAGSMEGQTTEPVDSCSPASLTAAVELHERIDRAIVALPPEQGEAIVLHLQGGLTFGAIARHQGVSVHTARNRYRYALQKLRPILDGEVTE
ncbi:MAG: sigma-70 family RNA polymerase sigma factor [Phycisphaerae bacterium]|nr:sigma-70 family RNA polymerase sigma factor [Phycisphaerae bacterium]